MLYNIKWKDRTRANKKLFSLIFHNNLLSKRRLDANLGVVPFWDFGGEKDGVRMRIIYTVNYKIGKVICYDGKGFENVTEEFRNRRNMNSFGGSLTDYDVLLTDFIERKIEDKTLLPNTNQSVSIIHDGKQYIALVEVTAE